MSGRRGFSLLELMVALTLTGIVALLVYGSVTAALDTDQRLRERAARGRAERAWRTVLEEALRNVRSPDDYRRPTLRIDSASQDRGRPVDRLWFITAGGTPPLTADADWEVVIGPAERGQLALTASPIGVNAPARRVLAPSAITGLEVEARGATGAPGWARRWQLGVLPGALALTYWSGDRPLAPVHLSLPRGAVP